MMARMYTISCVNLKGGVGKSTITVNLAACLHREHRRVLLVDADGQGTARTWAAAAGEADVPPVVAMDQRNIARDLPRVAAGFDFVVVDSPARLGKEARGAMLASSLSLLPVVPGAADVWALRETLDVLEEARGLVPDLAARIVLNQADHTKMGALVASKLGELGVPLMRSTLGHRVAYRESMLAGRGVVEYAPGSAAAVEFGALYHEVLQLLGVASDDRSSLERAAAEGRAS